MIPIRPAFTPPPPANLKFGSIVVRPGRTVIRSIAMNRTLSRMPELKNAVRAFRAMVRKMLPGRTVFLKVYNQHSGLSSLHPLYTRSAKGASRPCDLIFQIQVSDDPNRTSFGIMGHEFVGRLHELKQDFQKIATRR